jgi:AhpD family alkylhydroperoxidase
MMMSGQDLNRWRRDLAPETERAFLAFSQQVFADGALPAKVKQIIAVAVAHVTQCPYCIKGHTKVALRHGATPQELMEAIWVAAEMRAGASFAHSVLAVEAMGLPEDENGLSHGAGNHKDKDERQPHGAGQTRQSFTAGTRNR